MHYICWHRWREREREGDIVGVEATSKWDESPSMFEDSFDLLELSQAVDRR